VVAYVLLDQPVTPQWQRENAAVTLAFCPALFCPALFCPGFIYYPESNAHGYQFKTTYEH